MLPLFLLGAYHGLNPAMGWLFAVALGFQEKAARAVIASLLPLGAGHLLSVGLVLGVAQLVQFALPLAEVRAVAGVALIAFGLYRLIRQRHPRWVGMRVGARDLTLWSFLMASAHGAGLMLLPFVLTGSQEAMAGSVHHHLMAAGTMPGSVVGMSWWIPVSLHTVGYLLATALLALVIYCKVGLAILRRAWFNFDYLWIAALVAAGVLTLVL